MAYKALYREWRPRSFTEIIGQDHISKTLRNAVESNRTAHAYLFSGPRGTGKTSTAKILAKALNCESGPTANPCNACEACKRINSGLSLDVIEIDAASNRGIDEIRDLRERVKFAASEGRYKVYIIDEVHMLTTEAFNALLKTLEEPPSMVVFILATTEAHKIPATILSRVQRFDFKRISVPDILSRLKTVTKELPGKVDEDALLLIARKAEGGMRDALSILDQCYATGEILDLARVISVTGSVGEEEIYLFTEALIEGNIFDAIEKLNVFLLDGNDAGQIVKEVTEHLRNLLIIKTTGGNNSLIHATKDFWPKLIEQSSKVDADDLTKLISHFIKTDGELRFSSQPRITLELSLISVCSRGTDRPNQNMDYLAGNEAKAAKVIDLQTKGQGSKSQKIISHKVESSTKKDEVVTEDKSGINKPQNLPHLVQIKDEWKKILEAVKQLSIGTHAFLVEGFPISLTEGILTIGFKEKNTFHRDKIEQIENRTIVEQALYSVFGYNLGIKCITSGEKGNKQSDIVDQTYQIFPQELVEIKD